MSKVITLRDANQRFSRCIREVEAGEEFVITRNGKPVARLIPTGGKRVLTPEQEAARERALAVMTKGWPIHAGPLNRDELYDDIIDRKI
ncbi:MAG TPA: type II toxin-antitoxin system prevent-host-death family antitoxin [Stellaceae bacterium]|nr:type II toxin-antitoxin system prevent-host-death family antitoxin [Stellaceae bacterium]